MYEDHFGLKSNPFRSAAKGTGVFIGPQQAAVISRLQKALAGSDNVVTVTGPVGVGKTTVVKRTLETNNQHQMVAWIGRMRLAPDEMLDLLLGGFGVKTKVTGTVRRFALFKRLLAERVAANIRVVIAVEDALRIGTDALLELEALTANDVGNDGANIILMGPPEIEQRLNAPELARLRQRTRVGQSIAPFSVSEVQGYLKHCMREAGASFDMLFDEGAASMLHRCSGGLARVIDNVCDAALSAAAETHVDRISCQLIQDVALDVYGLRPAGIEPVVEATAPEPAVQEADESVADPAASLENRTLDDLPMLSHSMRVEIPKIIGASTNRSESVEADAETEKNHALPDLDALASAITMARGKSPAEDESEGESENPDLPEIITAEEPETAVEQELTPETESKLETGWNQPPEDVKVPAPIPSITLDRTLEEQRKTAVATDTVALELANAKSLEDISDAMAETLFGIEFQEIAAAAVSMPPSDDAHSGGPDAEPRAPESIEDQFQTSITQTLKVVDPDSLPNVEDESEKSGLFRLFKKSFKG